MTPTLYAIHLSHTSSDSIVTFQPVPVSGDHGALVPDTSVVVCTSMLGI